jgi:predicted transcriptional regulator
MATKRGSHQKAQHGNEVAKVPPQLQQWLFNLLKFLGVEQKTIAMWLGVSKTLVSFWASGREPIPRRYLGILHNVAHDAVINTLAKAKMSFMASVLFTAAHEVKPGSSRVTGSDILGSWSDPAFQQRILQSDDAKEARGEIDVLRDAYQSTAEQWDTSRKQLYQKVLEECQKVVLYAQEDVETFTMAQEKWATLRDICHNIVIALDEAQDLESFADILVHMREKNTEVDDLRDGIIALQNLQNNIKE